MYTISNLLQFEKRYQIKRESMNKLFYEKLYRSSIRTKKDVPEIEIN